MKTPQNTNCPNWIQWQLKLQKGLKFQSLFKLHMFILVVVLLYMSIYQVELQNLITFSL